METGLFFELYDEAKKCENVDAFIDCRENDAALKEIPDVNIVLLLRFIYEVSHMGIKEIREYRGMLRSDFCEVYEFEMGTVEDWEEGKTPVPQRLLKLLSYTLVEDFLS